MNNLQDANNNHEFLNTEMTTRNTIKDFHGLKKTVTSFIRGRMSKQT